MRKRVVGLGPLLSAALVGAWPAAVAAQSAQAPMVKPEWLRKPSFDQVATVYPVNAHGLEGKATILCQVTTLGLLVDCFVANEKPYGYGFGGAALALAPTFLMKPALRDGKPIEAQTTVTIDFQTDGTDSRYWQPLNGAAPRAAVLPDMVWLRTPTVAEILAELNKKSSNIPAGGSIIFQCVINKTSGKLASCNVVNVGPGMDQFKGVALALTDKFQADTKTLQSNRDEVRVNLVITIPDTRSDAWANRYLTHPRWIRTISPDVDKATFPEAAASAGLRTGSAIVHCTVTATGGLTHCQAVSESTPNLGFGPMAQQIAEVFVANPWSDGLPVEGAHVRMPIRMNYTPPRPPPRAVVAPPRYTIP
jgi:hypothetical protein